MSKRPTDERLEAVHEKRRQLQASRQSRVDGLEAKIAKLGMLNERVARMKTLNTTDSHAVRIDGATLIIQKGMGILSRRTHEIDETVSASVDSGVAVKGRSILGAALLGAGSRKGEVFLLVEGADWAETLSIKASKAAEAHKFAQRINMIAHSARSPAA